MANISLEQIAQQLLDACVAGEPWRPDDVDTLVDADADALFGIVAEGLADRFDSRLTECYVEIFSHAIARVDQRFSVAVLRTRYHHIRQLWRYRTALAPKQAAVRRILEVENKALRKLRTGGAAYRVPGVEPPAPHQADPGPARIVLLSRVTLGADIAVTSIVAQALQTRFPDAELMLAGSAKSAELLGLPLFEIAYPRLGGMRARLRAMDALSEIDDYTIVVDPDSRLTQLGLYPVVPEDRYYFFDSRSAESPGSLSELARDWCADVFEVDIPRPKMTVGPPPFEFAKPAIAVSLGVGGNEAKRIGGAFERDLLRELSRRSATVILDKGAGQEEAARAESVAAGLPNVRLFNGSFAGFAALIAKSDLYVGYDSAGQHAAAALGVPLLSVFAGAVNDRFFERWRPDGRVIRVDGGSPQATFIRVRSALPLLNKEK
ncbi:MAG TPA: glycosyltransferase family 9 protein [Bryobacteraceae bacterium]